MDFVTILYIAAASIIAAFAVISASVIALRKLSFIKRPLAPYVIVGALFCMFAALSAIVAISQNYNPTVPDRRYMQDYQEVDKRFNRLSEERELFESLYDVEFNFASYSDQPIGVTDVRGETNLYPNNLTIGKNGFSIVLRGADGSPIEDANITALISSVDGAFDQTIGARYEASAYHFDEFDIAKEGRYRVTVRVAAPKASAYLQRELYAR
ncbi:MAG: hypothetical protein LBI57_06245 [Helicobacteraceae bacterium]|jgi:hypothetical protein|nr:hypothetical protein [Helicobacteraceae bacterium]